MVIKEINNNLKTNLNLKPLERFKIIIKYTNIKIIEIKIKIFFSLEYNRSNKIKIKIKTKY